MTHIKKMELEQQELFEKISNLKKFLFETANINEIIDDEQEENLKEQLLSMELYNLILIKRIKYDKKKFNQ